MALLASGLGLPQACQVAQPPDPRREEVLPTPRRDRGRQWMQEVRRVAVDRRLARPVVPDQRVLVVSEAQGVAVLEPLRLDELELAREVRLEAEEHHSA